MFNVNDKVNFLRPFTCFCSTIGILPTSYVTAMTYEEQIMYFCKYLEETVIPTVNGNASAITELQNLFTELSNYVTNYLDSPEFKQDIEDKLDQMAQDGSLANILANVVISEYTRKFKTYNDMIKANLSVGDICYTMGYATFNDGGNGLYQITENAVDSIYNTQMENNLTATKLVEDKTNIYSFGIVPNTDISSKINVILAKENEIHFNNGIYLIDVNTKLKPKSNQKLIGNQTTIRIGNQAYSVNYYAMLDLNNVKNVTIEGISFNGAKGRSMLDEGTGGHCITIETAENIIIKNCKFINSWYDGIVIDDISPNIMNSVEIINCEFNANGRNGISVTSCHNVNIKNCHFYDIFGDKLPQACIDIEPYNSNDSILENINISGIYAYNCKQGINNYLDNLQKGVSSNINISNIICDMMDVTESNGLYIGYYRGGDNVNISYNNISVMNATTGIRIVDWSSISNLHLDNIYLSNILSNGILVKQTYTWSYDISNIHFGSVKITNSDNANAVLFESASTISNPFIRN